MKRRDAAYRLLGALTLALGFAAPLYLLGQSAKALCLLWTLPLCVPLSFAPRKRRMLGLAALAVANAALGWLLLPLEGLAHIGLALLSAAIPLASMPLLCGGPMLGAQAAALAVQVTACFFNQGEARALLVWLGTAQVIAALFYLNVTQVRQQCEGRPARLMSGNLCMTALAAGCVLLLANAGAVWEALKAAARQVLAWIAALLALLDQPGQTGETVAAPGGMPDLGAAEEAAPIWRVLEVIIEVIALAVAAWLLLMALRRVPALLRRVAAALRRVLARYLGAAGADYVDEQQALTQADEAEIAAESRRKRLRRRKEPDWKTLDNRQRVREAYRRMSERAKPGRSLTAREALTGPMDAPALADAYDRARYSDEPVSDAEAERARSAMKARKQRSTSKI